jgi:hypothetical protein
LVPHCCTESAAIVTLAKAIALKLNIFLNRRNWASVRPGGQVATIAGRFRAMRASCWRRQFTDC